jgi:SseB protein N-terminal domain
MSGPVTPLDWAQAAAEADPESERARLRFHERLLDAELHLVLEREPEHGRLEPAVVSIGSADFVLAFDLPERMAAVFDRPAPYAALSGRSLVAMLAGRGIGIAVNPGASPYGALVAPEAVAWLAEAEPAAAEDGGAAPVALHPPSGAADGLLAALEPKLAAMGAWIEAAHLALAEYPDGARRLLLALVGVPEAAQAHAAEAVAEAVRFSGDAGAGLELIFLPPDAPVLARIGRVALRFELRPPAPTRGSAPGSDPERPPRLR